MSRVSSMKSKGKRIVGQVTEDEYIVEKIVGKKFKKDGTPLYLIKWKGWATIHNTFEPKENLSGCPELLEKFEKAEKEKNLKNAKAAKNLESRNGTTSKSDKTDNAAPAVIGNTKAEILDFVIQEEWPRHLIPLRLIRVVTINQTLTYIVKVQSEQDHEDNEKKDTDQEEDCNSKNTVVIYSHGFKHLFPHIVIDYYQNQVVWTNPDETA